MSTIHADGSTAVELSALEVLRADLQQLAEAEEEAKLDVKVAQSKATDIATKRKKLERVIRLLSDDASTGITKKAVEELLAKALSKGPVDEAELRTRLETGLKNTKQSTSGLGLILSKLRDSYVTDTGQWALPTPDKTAAQA